MHENYYYSARIAGEPPKPDAAEPKPDPSQIYGLIRSQGRWRWYPGTQNRLSTKVEMGERTIIFHGREETQKQRAEVADPVNPSRVELTALLALVKREHEAWLAQAVTLYSEEIIRKGNDGHEQMMAEIEKQILATQSQGK